MATSTHSGGNGLRLNDGSGVFTDTDQTLGVGNAAAFIRTPSGGWRQ